MNWKIISGVISAIALLAGLVTGSFTFYEKVAWAEEVQQSLGVMAKGTQIQIDNNYLESLQDRRRNIQQILEVKPNDLYAKEELEYLSDRIMKVRERIDQNTKELTSGQ